MQETGFRPGKRHFELENLPHIVGGIILDFEKKKKKKSIFALIESQKEQVVFTEHTKYWTKYSYIY